ncbi:sodium:calcium antiporter [Nannocystis pusilla]|uniref:Sodium/calcium exchanger membrane region domain-containing protein n=1 Tax=Nannocystis pusilla TaxID=889268 RepID=A0ABS7U555_9BACT|nr:hypothetical protein [Nannocystis pusilla]MBZ5715695.1 hypothetical protein [Nannocystis pusilla]
MLAVVVRFAVSALVIVVAGTLLTRLGDTLAERTGFGRVLVGAVLLALATSLPEVTVDVHAARLGNPDLAVGDLMGSSLFNLLILAIADLLHRAPASGMFKHSAVIHALSATASILLTALAGMAILAGGVAIGLGRVGLGSIAILCSYLFVLRLVYRDQRLDAAGRPNTPRDGPGDGGGWGKPLLGFSACAAVILVAAPHLARSADAIAEQSGLGGTFVGTTLVALVTSLPELVATLTAVRIGAFALAAGNIFGSNAINMVLLFPVELAHGDLLFRSVSPVHAFTALAVVLVTAVVVMGQLYRVESRRMFVEPDALLVITLVVGALLAVYFLGDMSQVR